MSETTNIEWCDSTFNPWIGCTRVSPACDDCYAARSTPARTLGVVWGAGEARRRTSEANWKLPIQWERDHAAFFAEHGRRRRVFCASLADVFDNEVDPQWRDDLFHLIEKTPNIDWLILTKRVGNVLPMLRLASEQIDKAYLTGYDKAHDSSTTRAGGLRGGSVGRNGDRRARPNLALEEENVRPLGGGRENDPLQSSSCGSFFGGRVSAGSSDAGWQASCGSSSPVGLAALQGSDSGRNDDQPQERKQGEQSSQQLGAGDIQRAEDSRHSRVGSEASRRSWIKAPEDSSDRGGCDRHEAPEEVGRNGQGAGLEVRRDAEGSVGNLSRSNLEARPDLGGWIQGWLQGQPPKNVWLGATVVNQAEADRDIPKLLAVPARVRFLSIEPMLGAIDLRFHIFSEPTGKWRTKDGKRQMELRRQADGGLHWIIVGGESGPKARPMHPDWARSLRDQCAAAGVPFLFKQHGEWIGVPDLRNLQGGQGPGFGSFDHCHYDSEHEAVRVGKKAAGRLLDGIEHNGYPGAA